MSTQHATPKPRVADPLVKPMHLRLTSSADEHIHQMAERWALKRQDAVRRIIRLHMRAMARVKK